MSVDTRGRFIEVLGTALQAVFQSASPGYLSTMAIPIVSGRGLAQGDNLGAPAVALVNRSFARAFLSGRSPLGRTLVVSNVSLQRTPTGDRLVDRPYPVVVVGVVGDARQLALDVPPGPAILMPYAQRPADSLTFILRPDHPNGLPMPGRERVR